MADQSAPPTADKPQPSIRVAGQYIKDLSFENPSVGKPLQGPVENPQLQVEVNVNAHQTPNGLYESVIHFTGNATSNVGPLYKIELDYGGMFKIDNMPQQALEPFLLVNAPALLFPFVRRLLADITREGGFPPLLIDPIDFGSLYVQRKQAAANGKTGNATVN